ncbi:hypothetical protein CERSUDRAFT_123242 [Gelatoporia subvermispora B]|uniref:Chromatin modification-related protein n=1 Tax=Ceriporiopsis subvermispora (strain B) TaxID=914234 RepID=M2RJQ6_CERS8|nr:hypothetical protein CERSUDRAFT_123242 [Gelatoporia subvermispora B]
MSHRTPKSRKRRRSQAVAGLIEDTTGDADAPVEDGNDAAGDADQALTLDGEPESNAEPTKEQVIWDAFREEHYELLEQLPLSLHRSFALMRELDQQVLDYRSQLLPKLKDYISLRRKLHADKHQESAIQEGPNAAGGEPQAQDAMVEDGVEESDEATAIHALQELAMGRANGSAHVNGFATTGAGPAPLPKILSGSRPSSREMLTRVAQLAEEILRASNEKVNVARFAYDLVDRYIRDLDRAIKEQESSLTLGVRPGTHLANIMLPEPVVPRSTRGSRAPQSPVATDVDTAQIQELGVQQEDINIGVSSGEPPAEEAAPMRKRKRGRSRRKSTPKEVEVTQPEQATRETNRSLKLTVPPLASVALYSNEMPIDPNEPRYCHCNQVSYGEMIACDNQECPKEWFHLGCEDLKTAPKGRWFCRDCAVAMTQAQTSRRKAR